MALHGIPICLPGNNSCRTNRKFERSAKRTYLVYADPTDSDIDVMRALPAGVRIFTADPSYGGFVVVDVEVKDEPECCTWPSFDGGDDTTKVRMWHVEVTYEPYSLKLNSADGNPLNQPPRFRFACTRGAAVVDADVDGNPIINSAGDRYDPPVEKNKTLVVLIVTRNEQAPDFPTVLTWCDRVNADEWNGFPPRTLLVAPINLPDREYFYENDLLYYPMEYQWEFNPDTWDKQILDQGTREVDSANGGKLKNILVEGQPAQEPCLLDGAGHALQPPVNKSDVRYNTVQVYPTLDFGVFNLDNLFESPNAPTPPAPVNPTGNGGNE